MQYNEDTINKLSKDLIKYKTHNSILKNKFETEKNASTSQIETLKTLHQHSASESDHKIHILERKIRELSIQKANSDVTIGEQKAAYSVCEGEMNSLIRTNENLKQKVAK